MSIISLTNHSVVNPTNDQLLNMVKADIVLWNGPKDIKKNGYYRKLSVTGPFPLNGKPGVYYQVILDVYEMRAHKALNQWIDLIN